MINIKGMSRKSCGLRKMTVDYISTSVKGSAYTSKHDMFKYHTYEEDKGIYEEVIKSIERNMGKINKKARYEVNDVYEALIDKAKNSSTDFDYSKSKMYSYCFRLLEFVFQDIAKEIKTGKGPSIYEAFTTEEDKKNNDSVKVSVEDKILSQSLLGGEVETDFDEINFDGHEARVKLVNYLYQLLAVENSAFRTTMSHLNIITYIQGNYAHQHYVALEEGTGIKHATKRKDIFGTFGMHNSALKHRIRDILAYDYGNQKSLHSAIKGFLEVCKTLHIPIMHIDAELVMNREYIDRLYMLLHNKNIVCVSEYDLPEFEGKLTLNTVINNTIRNESLKRNIPRTKLAGYLMEKEVKDMIFNMKASDFRDITKVVSKIEAIHVNEKISKDSNKPAKSTAGDLVIESLKDTMEQKSRENTLHKVIAFYHTVESGKDNVEKIPGPLSDEAQKIFNEVINRYRMRLASHFGNETRKGIVGGKSTVIPYNEQWLKYLGDITTEIFFMRQDLGLVVDGNGFIKYEKTGHYYEHVFPKEEPFKVIGDKDTRFHFEKYLVHSSGFLISKFIDGRVNLSKRELEIYNANSKGNFEYLIIKTIMNETLLRGYTGKW